MSFLLPVSVEITWKRVWLIAGALAVIGSAIIGLTWSNRMDYLDELKNEISSRKEASEWKVPETIKRLKSASEKLDAQLASMEAIDSLKVKNRELEKANTDLTEALTKSASELVQQNEHASRLAAELKLTLLPAKEFVLMDGESAELIKNRVTLGVYHIYPSWVVVTLNNEQETMYAGNHKTIKSFNGTCTLTLKKLAAINVTFSLTCDE
ncbi:TMF family protein [Pseudomonas sp. NFPP19]|uniref:TMF family protein n=1 Tax=Pseudomonas sp. NFPP19 TaxID=1566225 RepID=UPI0008CD11EC|nr:TMF family protein [Pseudomonas sp. NFPP19]SEP91979.1 hypothetical protein SAMN03159354_00764 [Pseudomonas sp. NFPP19]